MTKKCLACGNVSDNNLYACQACFKTVKELKRYDAPEESWDKEAILQCLQIAFFAILVVVLICAIHFYRYVKLQTQPLGELFNLKVLGPLLLVALALFFLIKFLMRKLSIHCIKYYLRHSEVTMLMRAAGTGRSGPLVMVLTVFLLGVALFSWLCPNLKFSKVESIAQVEILLLGILFGYIVGYRYFDWMRKLEK